MQHTAAALDVQLDLTTVEAAARRWATRARALVNRAACDDQEAALAVTARQFDSAATFLDRGDITKAREALYAARSYAASEEAMNDRLAKAASTLLEALGDA
ncbi:hypothetical protein GCM10014715_39050 [Streptomyces spiralis]|uniref:Uncharacterized protein n=1 Tax=Streptomyces spiralis TaxID=66376 RepID=A0A919A0J8_9ACTN|nr:hypothetical protein [Streptomyces spiralis]GHE79909.1 hypothetical protein GCM10014715_39050 [Streptomyces spiralis]